MIRVIPKKICEKTRPIPVHLEEPVLAERQQMQQKGHIGTRLEQIKVGAAHLSGAKIGVNHRGEHHEKLQNFLVPQN